MSAPGSSRAPSKPSKDDGDDNIELPPDVDEDSEEPGPRLASGFSEAIAKKCVCQRHCPAKFTEAEIEHMRAMSARNNVDDEQRCATLAVEVFLTISYN